MRNFLPGFFIGLLFIGCQKKSTNSLSLLDVCPEDATVVLKINQPVNFRSQFRNNELLEEFDGTGIGEELTRYFSFLSYLQAEEEGLFILREAADSLTDFLYISKAEQPLFDLEGLDNQTVESHATAGLTYLEYQLNDKTFFTTTERGLSLISSSVDFLKTVVESYPDFEIDPAFRALYLAADPSKDASVFLKPGTQGGLLHHILNRNSKIQQDLSSGWVSLDLQSGQDYLHLSGILVGTETERSTPNLFQDTRPVPSKLPKVAPKNTEAILSYSFHDYTKIAKNQARYFDHKIPGDTLFRTVEEVGMVYLGGKKAVILNTFASEGISEFLKSLETGTSSFQGNEIHVLRPHDFLHNYFAPMVTDFQPLFSAVIEDAFIFTKDESLLREILRSITAGTTFEKSDLFRSVNGSLAEESNMLFVARAGGIPKSLTADLNEEFGAKLDRPTLKNYTLASQLIADEDFSHVNLLMQKTIAPAVENTTTPLFSVALDAPVATHPQFVLNHRTRKKEIVVQDEENSLYLISTEGKVLWKKELEGRIQGNISQVDLYRNGRLQLAFTTNNQFLILDRNDKEVAPFQMKFEGGNLNPLAVFDYEGKKDYRFVITQGEKIFMYNRQGKIVSGFTFTSAESAVIQPPKHIRIRNKDYLIFMTEKGRLRILNRRGKVRVEVKESIDFSGNGVFLFRNNFITSEKSGELVTISEKGKLSRTKLNLTADHGLDATVKTLAVMNDNILTVKGKEVTLDLGVYTKPRIFYLYDKIYVSVTDLQSEQVYLFDSNAESISSFPVFGASMVDLADMDNDRKPELVVKGDEASIVVYRMN